MDFLDFNLPDQTLLMNLNEAALINCTRKKGMIGGKLAYLFEFFIFINVLFYELPNLLDLYISQSLMTTLPKKKNDKAY